MKAFINVIATACLCVAAMALVSTAAYAQGGEGYVAVLADAEGTDCHPKDLFPHVFEVFVLHLDTDAASGSEFMIETGGGFDGTFLGEFLGEGLVVQVGNSLTGTAIGYGACYQSPVVLLRMTYYCTGQSQSCSYFRVTGFTVEGRYHPPAMVDCGNPFGEKYEMDDTVTYVNSNENCPCTLPGFRLAANETTWGRIKSMYDD